MPALKRHVYFVSIIAILFVTGLSYVNAFRGQSSLLTPTVSADEEEDDQKEVDEKDSDEDKKDVKESDDEDEKDDEEENENEDDERKVEYKKANATSRGTSINTRSIAKEEAEDDEEEGDVEEGDKDDDKEELLEKIGEISKDLSKVEFKIGILSANGIQVANFTPILADVRAMVGQATEKMSTAPAEVENILETAEHKLERLEKLVKVELDDEDEDEDESDAAEKIRELANDIAKIEGKLNLAVQEGADVATLKLAFGEVKDLLNQAQEKMNAGDLAGAEVLAKMGDKKLESLEHSLETVFDDEDKDEEDAGRYKSEVAQFVHNLKNIAEIEGGIGQQVNAIAQTQNDSALRVENAMADVDSRNGFTQFLIGPKYKSIAEIENAIKENQASIKVLSDMVAQITDPAVKQVLQNQIVFLNQQNTTLQSFINQSEDGFSMFGWLTKLFY